MGYISMDKAMTSMDEDPPRMGCIIAVSLHWQRRFLNTLGLLFPPGLPYFHLLLGFPSWYPILSVEIGPREPNFFLEAGMKSDILPSISNSGSWSCLSGSKVCGISPVLVSLSWLRISYLEWWRCRLLCDWASLCKTDDSYAISWHIW